jgi:hypothetical protein
MRILLAAGADRSLKAEANTTLLMSAAGSGHLEVVKFVYEELDSQIGAVNQAGSTVMHAAVTGTGRLATQEEICEVIQFLADHGAKLDEPDGSGLTPIEIADRLPIDKGVDLLTALILKSGKKPRVGTLR